MIISVSQLNNLIKGITDSEPLLQNITVKGEICNLKASYNNAYFFTLKDENAQIDCYCNKKLGFEIDNGLNVIAHCFLNYYIKNGKISLYINELFLINNQGSQYIKFLQLKNKLEEEGLFDISHKKAINVWAENIGVVTSIQGAAIKDITSVLSRRNPAINIMVYPVKVQGTEAEETIIQGLLQLDKKNLDTIILGRGGGSNEDLSVFNSESIVRVIYSMKTPIISAVGHETNFTLTDFAADMRAPTPSAAAELATIDLTEKYENISIRLSRIYNNVNSQYNYLKNIFKNTIKSINIYQNNKFNKSKDKLSWLIKNCRFNSDKLLQRHYSDFNILLNSLDKNNPLEKIRKGYAYITQSNKPINSIKDLHNGTEIHGTILDGTFDAIISNVENRNAQKE